MSISQSRFLNMSSIISGGSRIGEGAPAGKIINYEGETERELETNDDYIDVV